VLYIKAFHIIFVITWFAALFYLPRLFVYHAELLESTPADTRGDERFRVMERKLLKGIMTPSAIGAIALGTWLWLGYGFKGGWLHAKLALVLLLIVFHGFCVKWQRDFAAGRNTRSGKFFRMVNEVPVIPLIGGVILVVVKPF
jgi:protoporphyrinogen IX oxidase